MTESDQTFILRMEKRILRGINPADPIAIHTSHQYIAANILYEEGIPSSSRVLTNERFRG